MIQFPYGIADFRRIRREGMVYLDRTGHLRDLETLGSVLVFLRPRRFGKSLWLQTLATYYDLRYAGDFDEVFDGLEIQRQPTDLANSYFVLQWNFSLITPRGSVDEIAESLRRHVRTQAEQFLLDYTGFLEAEIPMDAGASEILATLLGAVRRTGRPLYLLIDEYDNFVNEVMVKDVSTYKALFEADGPYKELMKAVKNATEGLGLERVFVTGVSPLALNDLTSGFNTAKDISLSPELAALCGFREREIRHLLERVERERSLPEGAVESALDTMRTWYNGYRFTNFPARLLPAGFEEGVYNPINVLYFLEHLYNYQEPPETLQDENLRPDQAKLAFMARTGAGAGVIEALTEGTGEIEVPRLVSRFSLDDLTARLAKDRGAVASFLYYMGLLTLTGVRGRLRLPNLVIRKLFLDRLLEIFLPQVEDSYQAREIVMGFFRDGDLSPLLAFFEDKLLPVLSNRDQGAAPSGPGQSGSGVNEMTLKALFLSVLFDDTRYVVHSELEVERGYADLCLLVRPETRWPGAFDILLELKLVRRKTLGQKGRELSAMDERSLGELPAVKTALAEAREQIERYRAALVRQRGDAVRPRCYAVVAVGLERLLGEEVRGRGSRRPASDG
jgi:hypothetical protein